MEISVRGMRVSPGDWEEVRSLPLEQLRITEEQRATARELRVPEDDYARSAEAGRRNQERLLAKTERFARFLETEIRGRGVSATIHKVTLDTWDEKFEVELELRGAPFFLRVDEAVVDELMESGTVEARDRLARILDMAFRQQVA